MQSRTRRELKAYSSTMLLSGVATAWTATTLLIRKPGLKRFAVLPIIANAILYGVVVILGIYFVAAWEPHVGPWNFGWGIGSLLAKSLNWAFGTLKWVIGIPLMLTIIYFTFTVVGMVAASPLNDLLSDRVERSVCGTTNNASLPLGKMAVLVSLSFFDSLVIVLKQAAISLLVLPLLLVPVIGFLPLLLVTGYYTGLGFVDVAIARNHLRGNHKQAMIQDRRWEILGLGLTMELLFFIPFVGLLILPIGVTAGTLLYSRYDWPRGLASRGLQPPDGFTAPQGQS